MVEFSRVLSRSRRRLLDFLKIFTRRRTLLGLSLMGSLFLQFQGMFKDGWRGSLRKKRCVEPSRDVVGIRPQVQMVSTLLS